MIRPGVDAMLLEVASTVATRATCARLRVGAVLARDGRILSTGYNGAPAGRPHCQCVGDRPCEPSVHAEANALIFAARHGVAAEGATLVCTHAPCLACAGLIVNAGVSRVVYRDRYRRTDGLALLEAAGLTLERH